MAIFSLFSRFGAYFRRYGFTATLRRTALAAKRSLFSNRAVLFYCDLSGQPLVPVEFSKRLKVERKRSQVELDSQDAQQIIDVWNPRVARQRLEERFARGASLWLIEVDEQLAGFGWTLLGGTIAPYYFPLGPDDVQFFDFHVFPQFRGSGMNSFLLKYILKALAGEGAQRGFIDTAEWNQAQLSSLGKTPFQCLGLARKWTIFQSTVVRWGDTPRRGENVCTANG